MIFDFFKSIFESETYLGIDIGTTSIKLVEIERDKDLPRLRNYGVLDSYSYLERVNNAIQTSSLRLLEDDVVSLLQLLLKNTKTKTKKAVTSIPSFMVFSTMIEMPFMSESETVKAMKYQARQYVPIPLSQVAIDWLRVGEREVDGVKMQQIFLISVTNDQVRRYKEIFKKAGLKLIALESESLALIRSVVSRDLTPTALVDIGAKSTNIVITEGGYIKHNTQTDFAGSMLTQSIGAGLGISSYRAEELKKRYGLMGTGGNYELSTLMMSSLDAILSEVERAINDYQRQHESSKKIERVILSGGGAKLLGIDKYFEKRINLPVVRSDPFSRVSYPPEMNPIAKELSSGFAVAIGLGIRQLI